MVQANKVYIIQTIGKDHHNKNNREPSLISTCLKHALANCRFVTCCLIFHKWQQWCYWWCYSSAGTAQRRVAAVPLLRATSVPSQQSIRQQIFFGSHQIVSRTRPVTFLMLFCCSRTIMLYFTSFMFFSSATTVWFPWYHSMGCVQCEPGSKERSVVSSQS